MIRRMEIDDILAVVTIENACFSDPWTGKILEESLKTPWNYFWIALDQGKAVGYGALCLIAGEGEIQRIAVLPEARKRGIGKKLLETMVDFAKKAGTSAITLEVRAGNEAAVNLYKSLGFSEEAVRKGYYQHPEEDALIMWKWDV